MIQRDGFTSGFLTGTLVGGFVGGVLGTLVASRRSDDTGEQEGSLLKSKTSHHEHKEGTEESIEVARRSLEEKIAQLNLAIDDVRQQLGSVNGNALEKERE